MDGQTGHGFIIVFESTIVFESIFIFEREQTCSNSREEVHEARFCQGSFKHQPK